MQTQKKINPHKRKNMRKNICLRLRAAHEMDRRRSEPKMQETKLTEKDGEKK